MTLANPKFFGSMTKSYKTDWTTGLTKVVTHNLATTDLIVQVFGATSNELIRVDTVVRTDANTLTLTSSKDPSTNEVLRVIVMAA